MLVTRVGSPEAAQLAYWPSNVCQVQYTTSACNALSIIWSDSKAMLAIANFCIRLFDQAMSSSTPIDHHV